MAKILIVDDSPTEVFVIQKILEKKGYEVIVAEDGNEGLEKASTEMPDLVLMDVVMPGISGFQATRKLSKQSSTADIPVIIVTTKDQETDRIWGMRQGATDYLTKPVSEVALLSKIKDVLNNT